MQQSDGTLRAVEVHVFPDSMRGTGEGHRPWDLQPGSTMTNATVAKVDETGGEAQSGGTGSTMTNATVAKVDDSGGARKLSLKYKGGEKTVVVPPGTPVVRIEPGDRSKLVPGAHVFAIASRQPDGTLVAERLRRQGRPGTSDGARRGQPASRRSTPPSGPTSTASGTTATPYFRARSGRRDTSTSTGARPSPASRRDELPLAHPRLHHLEVDDTRQAPAAAQREAQGELEREQREEAPPAGEHGHQRDQAYGGLDEARRPLVDDGEVAVGVGSPVGHGAPYCQVGWHTPSGLAVIFPL